MFCASVLLLYAANRPNRLSGPAFMMKVMLRHHGLAGLMQRESGKAAPNGATRVPVADVVPRTRVGPTVLPTQFSRYGRWHGRTRSLQRASRLVKPHFNRVALNTQGLNWSLMLHAHKLRCLIQQARSLGWSLVMLLSDLHFCEDDWQSDGHDTPPGNCY